MSDQEPAQQNLGIPIAYYLERYHRGEGETAFHCLLEMSDAVLPALMTEYHQTGDIPFRVFLLNVIWQNRQPSVVPFLEKALWDPEPEVWKEALDGLVALASPASLKVLLGARTMNVLDRPGGTEWVEWIDEAIEQVNKKIESTNEPNQTP